MVILVIQEQYKGNFLISQFKRFSFDYTKRNDDDEEEKKLFHSKNVGKLLPVSGAGVV